jgi:peptide/nickel transport system ATP-binding protein
MKIEKLCIQYQNSTLVDIAFDIDQSLALVGQSGSGKSLSLKALLGMLPENMQLELDIEASFRLVNGETLAFVPQNPFTALSPLTKISKQFFASEDTMKELFGQVGLEFALSERFPPELLDEPTTALDPHNREVMIDLLKALQKTMGFKMLFVTHDMKSAGALCEDICVIKDGEVVETGSLKEVLAEPKEEYTRVLISSNFSNRDFRQ